MTIQFIAGAGAIVFMVVFGMCGLAVLFRDDNANLLPDDYTHPDDVWTLIKLNGFYGHGDCRDCGHHEQLHRGRCAGCWLAKVPQLILCDDCQRLWEPAPDDERDVCPRCRVQRVTVAIPAEIRAASDTPELVIGSCTSEPTGAERQAITVNANELAGAE